MTETVTPAEVYRRAIAAGLSEGMANELAAAEAGAIGPTGAPLDATDGDPPDATAAAGRWYDEALHPRGWRGRWIDKAGAPAPSIPSQDPGRPTPGWQRRSLEHVTPAERAALREYTTRRYREINGALRGQTPMTPELESLVGDIDSALRRNPLAGPVRMQRSSWPDEFEIADAFDIVDRVGVGRLDQAYTSTSVDWDWPGRPIRLAVDVPAGVGVFASYIAGVSKYPEQHEILLERNLTRVLDDVSYDSARGLWVGRMHVEVNR